MNAIRVLLVEDNIDLQFGLRIAFENEGYCVVTAARVDEALSRLELQMPHVIILDLMLPDGDGLDVLRHLKNVGSPSVVIILSARATESDRVVCLRSGSDDYMAKPFSVAELLERVRLRLRLYNSPIVVRLGDIEVDITSRCVIRGSDVIRLSRREAILFAILMNAQGAVVSRSELLAQGWRYPPHTKTRTLDYFVGTLRKKIERDPHNPKFLLTARGLGYQLKIPVQSPRPMSTRGDLMPALQ